MSAGRAKAFTTTRPCPSSDDIFSRRLPLGKSDQIGSHLAGDFCAAEQSLLSAYSQTTEEYYEGTRSCGSTFVAWMTHCSREAERF